MPKFKSRATVAVVAAFAALALVIAPSAAIADPVDPPVSSPDPSPVVTPDPPVEETPEPSPPVDETAPVAGYTVSGTITGIPDGAGAVEVTLSDLGEQYQSVSSTDGTFTFTDVPDGDWYLEAATVVPMGAKSVQYLAYVGNGSKPGAAVPVTGGDVSDLELNLVGSGAIAGYVDGPAVDGWTPDVLITAYRWTGSEWATEQTSRGFQAFSLGNTPFEGQSDMFWWLRAGEYIVSFTDPGESADYPYCDVYWSNSLTTADAQSFAVPVGDTYSGVEQWLKLKSVGCDTPPTTIVSSPVTVSGSMAVGEELTASTDAWAPAEVELSYQWLDPDGFAIEGATGATYVPDAKYAGLRVGVAVTGTRPDARAAVVQGWSEPLTAAEATTPPPSETATPAPTSPASSPAPTPVAAASGSDADLPDTGQRDSSWLIIVALVLVAAGISLSRQLRPAD